VLVGYARVSTLDQDTALQLDALKAAGVKRVYQDKGSGVGPRPQLHVALGKLRAGDVLVVWKLDRIARSLSDLLSIIGRVRTAGAAIKSLTEPVDTSSPIGEFTLQVLGAVAQLERSMIRERAIAGQVAAFRRGKRWGGQAPAIDPADLPRLYRAKDSGRYTHKELADMFRCSVATVDRALRRRRDPDWAKKKRLPVLSRFLPGGSPSSPPH
jgi:DNA invertase Pin-like site-specific DNA recombinase